MRRLMRGTPQGSITFSLRFASQSIPPWIPTLREAAKTQERNVSYDIKIYDDLAWRERPFEFDSKLWDPHSMSSMLKDKLCLGNEKKQYTVIGEAFPFADRDDSPVINEPQTPSRLLWDHSSPTEKIMIQLGPHFPPLLWLTVKPTIEALKRVFSEFIDADAEHMKNQLPYYESTQSRIETEYKEKFGETLSPYKLKEEFVADMRKRDPRELQLDWPQNHNVHLGTVDHFRITEDKLLKSNPFLFGWPLLVSDGNHFLEDTPARMASFRTIYSKSQILFHTRLDLQLDPRMVKVEETDEADVVLEVPVLATINYPANKRMCGGAAFVKRFNSTMGTSFPEDTPVDVLAVFAKEQSVKGVPELRRELDFLSAASEKVPDEERVVRLAAELHGTNRILGQLAYTIVYLALMEDAEWVEAVFSRFERHPVEMVRLACAKGAVAISRVDLVEQMLEREIAGSRTAKLLQTLVAPKKSD